MDAPAIVGGLAWIGAVLIIALIVGGLAAWVIKSAVDSSEPDDVP